MPTKSVQELAARAGRLEDEWAAVYYGPERATIGKHNGSVLGKVPRDPRSEML